MTSSVADLDDTHRLSAIGNIHGRFLDLVSHRLSEAISARELSEELLIEAMDMIEARYGFVVRVLEGDQGNPGTMEIEAIVSAEDDGGYDRSLSGLELYLPDPFFESVVRSGTPMFTNDVSCGTPGRLPANHPDIAAFSILPISDGQRTGSLVFLANPRSTFTRPQVNRLQEMLDAFAEADVALLINQGVHDVIGDLQSSSRNLITLTNASLNGIMTIDETGMITAFNPACEKIFGITTPLAVRTSATGYLPDSVLQPILTHGREFKHSLRLRDSRSYRQRDVPAMRAQGKEFRLDLVYYHTRVESRIYTTLILDDISDRIESARELQDTVTQFKTLTRLAPVGIIELGADWTCVYANDMWCQLSKLNLEETINTGWIDAIHADDVVQTLIDMRDALGEGYTFRRELRLQSPLGETLWVSLSATGLYNEYETLDGTLVVIMDITEKHLAGERLQQVAHHDELTGLLNRSRFLERLSEDIEECDSRCQMALMYIDLDGFKQVNDTYGHDHGDELLKQVAERLRSAVREEDSVARLGGDEFTVTLTQLPKPAAASVVADKIVNNLRLPFTIKSQQVFITASVGIAIGDSSTEERDALIKQADTALYRAKQSGRSRYIYFTAALDQAQRARSMLISSIRSAVDRRGFELYYQPQLRIDSKSLAGFEALLRWPNQGGAAVPTESVIDVMEETGLIDEVGQWVIKQACQQYMEWLDSGLISADTTMSVNVSASQLGMPHFVRHVDAILKRNKMDPGKLILEITESTLVQTVDTDVLDHCKALGVQISLDDFGTGYSSLAYLSQLPLDHLKIDRSFISNITHSPRAVTIVKSIIALARTLGISVVAEGVEDECVLPLLAAEGCESYQGYHVSMAVPAPTMPDVLESIAQRRLSEASAFIDLGITETAEAV